MDGPNIFYRSAYANKFLTTSNGDPSGGIYGAFKSIVRVIKDYKPTWCYVAWEGGYQGRLDVSSEYKANRRVERGSDDPRAHLHSQLSDLQELLTCAGIQNGYVQGYEADDVLAAYAERFMRDVESAKNDSRMLLISDDHDLISNITDVVDWKRPNGDIHDLEWARGHIGHDDPKKYLYIQALSGCPGDGVSGVPRIGEKTAKKILLKHDWDLDRALRLDPRLDGWHDHVYRNLVLVSPLIIDDPDLPVLLPLELSWSKEEVEYEERYREICRKWEMKSLIPMLNTFWWRGDNYDTS